MRKQIITPPHAGDTVVGKKPNPNPKKIPNMDFHVDYRFIPGSV